MLLINYYNAQPTFTFYRASYKCKYSSIKNSLIWSEYSNGPIGELLTDSHKKKNLFLLLTPYGAVTLLLIGISLLKNWLKLLKNYHKYTLKLLQITFEVYDPLRICWYTDWRCFNEIYLEIHLLTSYHDFTMLQVRIGVYNGANQRAPEINFSNFKIGSKVLQTGSFYYVLWSTI